MYHKLFFTGKLLQMSILKSSNAFIQQLFGGSLLDAYMVLEARDIAMNTMPCYLSSRSLYSAEVLVG